MSASGQIGSAATALREGRLRDAERILQRLIQDDPLSPSAHMLLGEVYLHQQRYDLAVAACATAVALDPQNASAYRQLAHAYRGLGLLEEALATLHLAIERQPAGLDAYLDAALVLHETAGAEEALAVLDQASRRCPGQAWRVEPLRLHLLYAAERFEALRERAQACLAVDPDDIAALEYLGAACYRLGDLAGAAAALRRLVARAPAVREYQLRLADLLREMGQTAEAVAILEQLADSGDAEDICAAAREGLEVSDESQIPTIMMLAGDSAQFRRELRYDPSLALARRGFALSRVGLASLAAVLMEWEPDEPGDVAFH